MSWLKKYWRFPALVLVATLPLVAACADDEGAALGQDPTPTTGTISGTVTNAETSEGIVGALVGTSPATQTALTDANGNYQINNVPIPSTGSASFAVTASADGFQSASTTVTLSETTPTATANLALTPGAGAGTTGNLNVLVTNRNGAPQSGVTVDVLDQGGNVVVSAETNDQGFALFNDLEEGSYLVRAMTTISGIPFQASAGVNVVAGETAFRELVLGRDFGQTTFPNVDGENVTLEAGSDIAFVPVPGGDSNPEVDCNIIRTQHMFIARVTNEDGDLVSGVKVEWDLNISENGTITVECPELTDDPAGCKVPTVPGNTGSIVDTDDPDLDPTTARSGLAPAFEVDSRRAVTFTNDDAQTVTFGSQSVTVGAGETWIIITSPAEGVTDVIAATPDIPISDPACANDDPDSCDKEFAIKRWVNWDTRVFELEWDGDTPSFDPHDDPDAEFTEISDGGTFTNVLDRAIDEGECVDATGAPLTAPGSQCVITGNDFNVIAEVHRLRSDSPFNISGGTIIFDVTDDSPDVDFFGEDAGNDGPGADDGFQNAEFNGPADDQYWIDSDDPGGLIVNRNRASVEFDANNNAADGGVLTQNPACTAPCDEDDFIGYGIAQVRLDPAVFFCVDVDGDSDCEPGASVDSFSTAMQRLLAGTTDNTASFRIRFIDEFGEVCGDFEFDKEFVSSRLQVIKSTPDATRRTVTEANGGPNVLQDTPIPVKTHTVQVGQTFSYTVTAINSGEVRAENVRITDTLPRFGVQFDVVDPDDGAPTMRNGSQAFTFVGDRPTFDPTAIVFGIDEDNDDAGDAIDTCIRGDNGTTAGNAYVSPAPCTGIEDDVGTVSAARAAAVSASGGGDMDAGDQVVWIQYFDDTILGRQQPGGGIESEDSVEISLAASSGLYDAVTLPGTWCNISTVSDGEDNNVDDSAIESFDADTLCHEVREALLDVRKTADDAIVAAGNQAVFEVEIANNGSAALTNVTIGDTLDAGFTVDSIIPDTVQFPGATVSDTTSLGDGRTVFTVTLGDLPPTSGFVLAYTVFATAPGVDGVFCNRVTATGQNPVGTLSESDLACITTTVSIELDLSNEDGFIDAGGVFQSAKEIFSVGEDMEDFAYQVIITNRSPALTATNVVVTDLVAPNSNNFEFQQVRAMFPTRGTVSGTSPSGFTWTIGDLGPGESAEIQFFAEALAAGDDVNRVVLMADQLNNPATDEETTTIQ